MNLSSARVWDKPKSNENDDQSDLLTVKGVPYYTCEQVRSAIQKDQQTAIYNPVLNDIIGIKMTLLQMILLKPYFPQNQKQQLSLLQQHGYLLKRLIQIFTQQIFSFSDSWTKLQMILQQINKLLGHINDNNINIDNIDPLQYQQLYDNDCGIFKNIESKLYFNNKQNCQYLQQLYEQMLFDLGKKQVFIVMMMEKIKRNYENQQKQNNLEIFLKLGRYVEQQKENKYKQFNQYYKQAFMLLITLGEEQRIEGFYKDHQRYVKNAQILMDKLCNSNHIDSHNNNNNNKQSLITRQSKNINKLKCLLMRESAYMKLYEAYQYNSNNYGHEKSNKNKRLIIKSEYNQKQKTQQILSLINTSILHSQRSNISFEQQLSLIYSRAQLLFLVYTQFSQLQQCIKLIQTGLQLMNNNHRQFRIKNNYDCMRCKFYALVVDVQLQKMVKQYQNDQNVEKKGQGLLKIQEKINKVQGLFNISVVSNVVDMVNFYVLKGDFNMLKKQIRQARKSYEKGLSLLRARNVQYKQKQQKNSKKQVKNNKNRTISALIQLQIVQKLIISITKQNQDILQLKKYKKLSTQLHKQTGLLRKSQKKYSRNGQPLKQYGKQKQKQKNQHKLLGLSQIKEQPKEEEQHHGFVKEQYKIMIEQNGESYFKRSVNQYKQIGSY